LFVQATPGLAQWTDVTSGPLAGPGAGYSVSWADFDGDGDPDLCLSQYMSTPPLRLFRNDGAGMFVDVTAPPLTQGDPTIAVIWGDADNDGDLDLFRVHFFEPSSVVCRNTGGTFAVAAPLSTKGGIGGAVWGDFDRDGDLDLVFVTHFGRAVLYQNAGGLSFTQGQFLPEALAPIAVDYDGDGGLDLHLVAGNHDALLRNDGGTFVAPGIFLDTDQRSAAAWSDYDRDGDPDFYLVKVSGTNRLLRNDGGGTFTDVTAGTPLGLAGDCDDASWVDVDNDGDLDLFVVRGVAANVLFRNDGGAFVNAGSSALDGVGTRRAAAWADYDGDGDLDVYVTSDSTRGRLIRNDLGPSHWLHVDLVGGVSNRSGIGARIRVKSGGVWQMQDVSGGSGFSQNSLTAEFGLGASTMADSVVVHWPSGRSQVLVGVAGNQRIVITESGPTGVGDSPRVDARLWPPIPNPSRGATHLRLDVVAARRVRVDVLDLEGRCVRLIADREFSPGPHDLEWDGTDSSGRRVPAGIYWASARSASGQQFHRLVRLR
jgi:hypothetical protein